MKPISIIPQMLGLTVAVMAQAPSERRFTSLDVLNVDPTVNESDLALSLIGQSFCPDPALCVPASQQAAKGEET